MTTDLRTAGDDPAAPDASPATTDETGVKARRGLLLLAAFAWNTWVWVTRIYNLVTGPEWDTATTAFLAVHLVLYAASLAVGTMVGVIGWRMWRETRGSRPEPAEDQG